MIKKILFLSLIFFWICSFQTATIADENEPNEIRFGFIPFIDKETMSKTFESIVVQIGMDIQMCVKIVFSPDYQTLREYVKTGKVDIAWFGPGGYLNAKKEMPNLHMLARITENGEPFYSGYIIAKRGSGIYSLKDLKGKKFGFVDKESGSGYIYPYAEFLQQKIYPEEYLKEIQFFGNHSNVIRAVNEGTIDAGTTYDGALFGLKSIDIQNFVIIETTIPIPNDVICARPDLSPQIIKKIKDALLSFDALNKPIKIGGYGDIGFIEGEDTDYDTMRWVIEKSQQQTTGIRFKR